MWTDRILNLNNKLELSQCGVNYVIIFTLQCLRNQTPFKTYHVWCDVHVGRAQCFWQQLFSNQHWLWMHRYKRQHTCRGSIHKGHLNAVICKVKQVFGLLWTITVRSNILEYLFFLFSCWFTALLSSETPNAPLTFARAHVLINENLQLPIGLNQTSLWRTRWPTHWLRLFSLDYI